MAGGLWLAGEVVGEVSRASYDSVRRRKLDARNTGDGDRLQIWKLNLYSNFALIGPRHERRWLPGERRNLCVVVQPDGCRTFGQISPGVTPVTAFDENKTGVSGGSAMFHAIAPCVSLVFLCAGSHSFY